MTWVWVFVAFCGGAAAATQPLLTGALGKQRGLFEAILISLVVSFAALAVVLFIQVAAGRPSGLSTLVPPWAVFLGGAAIGAALLYLAGPGIPAYYYVAGLLGLTILTTVTSATPRIGLGATLAATVAGQMIVGLIWDNLGALGLPHIPITPVRVLGVALLLAGVWFMRAT